MNWGWKIAVVYSLFVVLMLTFVFKASMQRNDLVTENYYAKEGDYSNNLTLAAKTASLGTVEIEMGTSGIGIIFPENTLGIEGEVYLYRPSDERLDKKYPLKLATGENQFTLTDSHFAPGKWLIKINWVSGGEAYYFEQAVIAE